MTGDIVLFWNCEKWLPLRVKKIQATPTNQDLGTS